MPAKDLIAASTRPLLLSLLAQGGESYGYALIQRVKELSGGSLQWSEGMLYPVLHRLQDEGLIEAEWRDSETGRKRKYYRLSKAGRRSEKAERTDWLAVHNTLSRLWNLAPTPG